MAGLRVRGGGGPIAHQQPAKRQRRADVLASLGEESLGVAGIRTTAAGSRATGAGVHTPSRPPVSLAAQVATSTVLARAAPAGATGVAAPARADAAQEAPAAATSDASEPAGEATAPPIPAPAEEAKSTAEASVAVGGPSSLPARITGENSGNGWHAAFVQAKDHWEVEQETLRGRFWHSETGCCFEWDQASGTLFQYLLEEAGEGAKPSICPVWSISCPDRHAWVWESLPMPPTDPAAKLQDSGGATAGEGSPAGPAGAGGVADTEAREGSSFGGGGSSSGPAMPPPAVPVKKRSLILGSSPTASHSAGSPASSSGADSGELPGPSPPVLGPALAEGGPQLPATSGRGGESASGAGNRGCTPPAGADGEVEEPESTAEDFPDAELLLSLDCSLVEDDDEAVEPLAAGEVSALPPAPPKAKPQACDMDLDIFGAPEEPAAEVIVLPPTPPDVVGAQEASLAQLVD